MRSAAVVLLLLGAACTEQTGCVTTAIAVEDASKVDLASPGRSGTVAARLTDGEDQPVPGKPLTFEVEADDATVHTAHGSTGADGWARVDLKRADPATLVALVRGDTVAVAFAGDARYCSAADEAPFRVVRR